jgi:hypothetical protein
MVQLWGEDEQAEAAATVSETPAAKRTGHSDFSTKISGGANSTHTRLLARRKMQ